MSSADALTFRVIEILVNSYIMFLCERSDFN